MLILADSGILLRLLERTDPLHGIVRQAVRILVGRGDEFVLSHQNVAEFWNGCTRPTTSRGGYGLDIAETDQRAKSVNASSNSAPIILTLTGTGDISL